MELFFIFLIFSAPLLAVSIIAFLQKEDRRKKWFNGAVFVLNIFFSSIGPLVISIMLLHLSTLSTLIAVVTMVGFVPSAASILLWYILSKESPGMMIGMNSIALTLLNIGLPLTLALLSRNDLYISFFEIFSYEFLAMVIGASAGFVFSPLTRLMGKRFILLGILFLTAALIGPGIYYEYQWLVRWIVIQSPDFTITNISILVFRYFGISGLSLFIYKILKELT